MADTNAGTATTEGTLPTVAVEGPAAQALAESAAVIGDLQFVMECCKRLLTELAVPEEDRDPLVPQALWSAALNGYARCFGKGSRRNVHREILHPHLPPCESPQQSAGFGRGSRT